MSKTFISALSFLPVLLLVSSQEITKVEWVQESDVDIGALEPAGVQSYLAYFVARGQLVYTNTFIPGKYHWEAGTEPTGHAEVTYNGTEFKVSNFQLLRHPPGTVSWYPAKGHQIITPNHIFGGVDPEFTEEVYICRAWHQEEENGEPVLHLVPGKYVPSRGICSVAFGLAYEYDQFEILILNDYGVLIGAGNGRDQNPPDCGENPPFSKSGTAHYRKLNESSEKVEWKNRDQVDLSELKQTGIEKVPLYICRAQHIHEETFVPGKFLTSEDSHEKMDVCRFRFNGSSYSVFSNYQLLTFPRGSVSWLRDKGAHAISPYTIIGGVDPEEMEDVYICRAKYQYTDGRIFLITGSFIPSEGKCFVQYGSPSEFDQYEILTLNAYGLAIDAGNGAYYL